MRVIKRIPIGRCDVVIAHGDITDFEGDAIVNPANSLMIMGGGVAGAIKRKGGEEIEKEAMNKAPVPVGSAIATNGGKLKVRHVIHAPTMERPAMRIGRENAYLATKGALELARGLGLRKVALPLMGAGVGGLSVESSLGAMLDAISEVCNNMEVWVVIYSREDLERALSLVDK